MRGSTAALLWVLTRVLVLAMLFTYAGDDISDVNYYHHSLAGIGTGGLVHTLVEYPLPAVAVVAVPWVLSGGSSSPPGLYALVFLLLALLADAWLLRRLVRERPGDGTAPLAWLLLVPALGAMTYVRFDLVPGVLVAVALLAYGRSARRSAIAVAVGACVKLWPVLLVVPVVAGSRARLRWLGLVAGLGLLTTAVTVGLAGWGRLFSPLAYQGARGLQIESVAATPALVWHSVHAEGSRVWFAPSRSWEVSGSVADVMLTATTVLTACLGIALLVAWSLVLRRSTPLDVEALVWLALSSITGFIVLGRVLSPQYLLWLLPAAAAGLAVVGPTKRALVYWTIGLGAAALLTNALYPALYRPLLQTSGWTPVSLAVLATRNVLLVVLLIGAVVMAARCLRRRWTSQAKACATGLSVGST